LRWAPFWDTKRLDLVVAPIFGPKARPPEFDQDVPFLRIYRPDFDPKSGRRVNDPKSGDWYYTNVVGVSIMHAISIEDNPQEPDQKMILTANSKGVFAVVKSTDPQGNPVTAAWDVFPIPEGVAAKRGSSEVHLGHLADGKMFLATIEPWHGSKVVVRLRKDDNPGNTTNLNFGPITVIDDTLDDGHALWTADVDGDGTSEIFAGHRGKDHRVSMYQFDGNGWNRTIIDETVAAQDLRGGDLDGNGRPDVVTVGGSTHNVVWYRPKVK
jgi:hypothetical protein